MSEQEPRWVRWMGGLMLALGVFVLFYRVTEMPIYEWDEARLAANAQEMMEKGDLMVTYFNNEPDHWSTKPSLMIILEAGSMTLFGETTWAFRLPALIASLITLIWLSWLGRKLTHSDWGLLAGGILGTMPGYMQYHGARTGDYEALLTLFLTITFGQFLIYLFVDQKKVRWVWIGIFLTLATLTKGIASYFFLPGMALMGLFFFPIWKKHLSWMIGMIILHFAIVLGYYFYRETLDPGYLQAVWNNELGGRFGGTIEQHSHPFVFYIKNFFSYGSALYFLLIPFWVLTLWKRHRFRDPLVVITVTLFLFEALISSAGTKLQWYDVPAYPIMALGFTLVIHEIKRGSWIRKKWKGVSDGMVFLVLISSFTWTIVHLSNHIQQWKAKPAYAISNYIRAHSEVLVESEKPVFAFYEGYHTQILFYMRSLDLATWINPEFWAVEDSSLVIFSQPVIREKLEEEFQLTLVDSVSVPIPVYLMRVQRKQN